MIFFENPKLYIHEYYNDKKNQVDLKCEYTILETNNVTEISSFNVFRKQMIENIELIKLKILQRYDALQSKYNDERIRNNTQAIKDEIFLDQYCIFLDIYQLIPLFELKIGLILFSEFDFNSVDSLK